MKSFVVKICFSAGLVAMIALSADAQRTGRRRGNTEPPKQDTTGTGQQVNNANQQPSGYNPYGNIPIVVDSTGLNTATVKKSLRPDNAFDKGNLSARTPLPYEHLRWDDALFAEKVWRELDLREKMNQTFRYEAEDDNGSQMFINMLLKAVNDSTSGITAFSDERFTTPMTIPEIQQLTIGSADTVGQTDPTDPSKIIRYVVTRASFDAKTVVKLRIKEEWVFDREASRMFVRILGICPLKTQFFPNGQEIGITT